ncbi:hypothetical protein SVAN01_11693 [Stagonosporopsis vannaccii]|nr:hypothetical protein SVAN01_11693 [Stagonosporopsis vannaccii]
MRSFTNQEYRTTQAETGEMMNLEVFATNLDFWDGPTATQSSLLGLIAPPHTSGMNISHVLDPDFALESPSNLFHDSAGPVTLHSPTRSSSLDHADEPHLDLPVFISDDDYSEVRCNLAKCDRSIDDFQFPSKYALMRFVRAFFKSMAPHFPILHQPTFEVASVPISLLLAVMACGATYSDEPEAAASIHLTALQLMSNHGDITLNRTEEKAYFLWELQTFLLLTYFGVYSKISQVRRTSLNIFSHAIESSKKAIKDIPSFHPLVYKDWVYQESMIRCVAGVGILGTALNYEMQAQTFDLPDLWTKIQLPSSRDDWLKEEQSWTRPPPAPYLADVMEKTFAGQVPEIQVDDLAFLAIVSAVLNHICSVEVLINGKYPSLWDDFVNRLSPPVQLLDHICNEQLAKTICEALLPTPILQQLSGMKRLLSSPELLHESEEMSTLFQAPPLGTMRWILDRALTRAAATLKTYCRMGLRHLQRIGPYVYAPMAATAVIEAVEVLLDEVDAETKSIRLATKSQHGLMPLIAVAEVLQDCTGPAQCLRA